MSKINIFNKWHEKYTCVRTLSISNHPRDDNIKLTQNVNIFKLYLFCVNSIFLGIEN